MLILFPRARFPWMVSPTREPAASVRCKGPTSLRVFRVVRWSELGNRLRRQRCRAPPIDAPARAAAAAPVSSRTPVSGGPRLVGLPAVRRSAASRARAHTMPSRVCRSETLMRGAASKWAAEEEAAQMLYGKLGVLLASVLWLTPKVHVKVGI